ncbi:Mrp/NBP35 family ATP-binding protein [Alteripontixanthobacter maritimus]|nr:Mrp/NBP35 family ATP-binding protein [Alteripontixanthobacter maritimus]
MTAPTDREPDTAAEPAGDSRSLTDRLPSELAGRVQSARLAGGVATIVFDASGVAADKRGQLETAIRDMLGEVDGVAEVRVAMTADRAPDASSDETAVPAAAKPKRTMIAIGSGKGGVGKSTLTSNLAVALARRGVKVGVVDADIYGPSQPTLLATKDAKPVARGKQLQPVTSPHGVTLLSMGHLVAADKAIAWRGPMAGNALAQLIEADWGEAELLLVDLPPGTGDVQLSMLQRFKPDGAVIVSTPQDLALIDAKRAMQLFETGGVPMLGMVENMAGYECPHCHEISDPFGRGGAEDAARESGLDMLGRVPLAIEIREAGDAGVPPALSDGPQGLAFAAIADALAAKLGLEPVRETAP